MRHLAIFTLALASMVPSMVDASYVIHPRENDPSPPAIVATSGKFNPSTAFALDRFGEAWEVVNGNWTRRPINDPPIPLDEVLFWEEGGFVTTAGELWLSIDNGWVNMGPPPSTAAGAPETPQSAELALRSVPNPTTDVLRVEFKLEAACRVSVRVFDVSGRLAQTILEGDLPAGEYAPTWDGRDAAGRVVPSGVYLTRVETAAGVQTGRMTVAR